MGKQTRREFLRTVGSAATSAGILSILPSYTATAQTTKAKINQPNIIFIMADDHASHALSCYGSKINKTPNLDRLAKDGMRFDNCFCTNSICAPSRAVILTGKYSHINGVIDNRVKFDGSQQTFPKLLQKDPNELNNLYDNPAYADVVKKLKAELRRLRKQYGDSDELLINNRPDNFQKLFPNSSNAA